MFCRSRIRPLYIFQQHVTKRKIFMHLILRDLPTEKWLQQPLPPGGQILINFCHSLAFLYETGPAITTDIKSREGGGFDLNVIWRQVCSVEYGRLSPNEATLELLTEFPILMKHYPATFPICTFRITDVILTRSLPILVKISAAHVVT